MVFIPEQDNSENISYIGLPSTGTDSNNAGQQEPPSMLIDIEASEVLNTGAFHNSEPEPPRQLPFASVQSFQQPFVHQQQFASASHQPSARNEQSDTLLDLGIVSSAAESAFIDPEDFYSQSRAQSNIQTLWQIEENRQQIATEIRYYTSRERELRGARTHERRTN